MFAALCDDDKYITEEIKKLLLEYAKDNRITIDIDEFESGEELLNSEKNYDIIVLDYQLGSTNGLTVAKELRKRNVLSSIIFLTSYPNFMIDAFEVNTFRFLLKPIDKSKFFKAIDDYIKIVDANYPITIIQNKELKKIEQQIVSSKITEHQAIIKKAIIEDIKKENEYGIYYYMNLYLHMIFNKISENSLGIIILTILIITMMYIF